MYFMFLVEISVADCKVEENLLIARNCGNHTATRATSQSPTTEPSAPPAHATLSYPFPA